ncbi:hypothetical protein V6N13_033935 [Hibiscus sabdariffa]|uniref:Uncharacterized protein n=1 Tax=Hibiscus sabdariffa TaxID=183260 RepID=A0ABR2F930_9ROSI
MMKKREERVTRRAMGKDFNAYNVDFSQTMINEESLIVGFSHKMMMVTMGWSVRSMTRLRASSELIKNLSKRERGVSGEGEDYTRGLRGCKWNLKGKA